MAACLRGRFRGRSPRAYLGIAGGPTTVLCPWRRFRRRSPWACHGVARGTTASQFLWWGLRWRSSRKPLYLHEQMVHRDFSHITGVQLQISHRHSWAALRLQLLQSFHQKITLDLAALQSVLSVVGYFWQLLELSLQSTYFAMKLSFLALAFIHYTLERINHFLTIFQSCCQNIPF